jgi:hypothetical protein
MKTITACLLLALLPGASLLAATQSSGSGREAFFRCKDAKGQTHYGDSMPAECIGQDTEVLSDRGSVIRVIDGAQALAEKAQRKAADDATRKQREGAEQRDHMLVDTYLSVQDIERLRDQRIGLVETQLRVDEQTLTALKDREQSLLEQVLRFQPYNDKPNARPIPDHVAEEMVSTVNSSKVTEDRLASKRAEEQELQSKFSGDIKRFKELRGLK